MHACLPEDCSEHVTGRVHLGHVQGCSRCIHRSMWAWVCWGPSRDSGL